MIKKLVQLFIKTKYDRWKYYKLIKEAEYKTKEDCISIQKKKLNKLLNYAIKNIPFYKRYNHLKLKPNNIFSDIKNFPIITKSTIRKNKNNLINKNYNGKFITNTSGGSTGEPIEFYQDNTYYEYSMASKMLFFQWAGREEGERLIRLWGSERDILQGGLGFTGFIDKYFLKVTLLNAFRLSKKKMKQYVSIINREKPKCIEAYMQSILELSKFIKKEKLKVYSPQGIISSAGTLSNINKNYIEQVFSTKIFNRYGSREVGDIACSCEENNELHINPLTHFIEILDKNLKPVRPNKIGDIYVTNLINKKMPLIRYKIGDVGQVSMTKKCPCGRGFPLIKKIVGRTVNIFINSKGEKIDGEYFTHLFYFKNWVKKFQIIQHDYNLIEIKIVLEDNKKIKDIKAIEKDLKFVMGNQCKIKWKFIKDIPPSKSGKYIYTISKLSQNKMR